MLDTIIQVAKTELGKNLSSLGVTEKQLSPVMGLAKNTVMDQFKTTAKGGNLDDILNLFNGKQSIQGSSLVNHMIGDYAGKLVSQFGFSQSTGKNIAQLVIPFIMDLINQKTPDSGLGKDDLGSMIGDNVLNGLKNNLMGKLGKLF